MARGVRVYVLPLCLFFSARVNARPFIYVASRRSAETDPRAAVRRDEERINGAPRARPAAVAAHATDALATRLARLNATPVPAVIVYG